MFSHQILSTKGPEAFEVSGGALPPGLTIANTGIISGTPTQTGTLKPQSRRLIHPVQIQGSTSLGFVRVFKILRSTKTLVVRNTVTLSLHYLQLLVLVLLLHYSKNEDVLKVTNAVISPTVKGLTVHWRLDETGTSAPDPLSGTMVPEKHE